MSHHNTKLFKSISRSISLLNKTCLHRINNRLNSSGQEILHPSRLPDVKIVEASLYDFVIERAKNFENNVALASVEDAKQYTYSELIELSDRLAQGICADGLTKKDVVVTCLPNTPEYVITLLGVSSRGGIVSGANANYTEAELANHLRESDAKYVVVRAGNLPNVLRASEALGDQIRKIYVVGKADTKATIVSGFDSLISHSPSRSMRSIDFDTGTDLVLLPFSSGTTGLPKGIMLSHRNFASIIQLITQRQHYEVLNPGESTVGLIPLNHIFGLLQLFSSLITGSAYYAMQKFNTESYVKTLVKLKVPFIYIVPPVLSALVKDQSVKSDDLSHVRTCIVGAAPVGQSITNQTKQKFPNLRLCQGYGMTECGVIHFMPIQSNFDVKAGSCGMLLPNYTSKVVDVSSGQSLGFNQTGELLVKSDTCMLGYHKNKKATSEAYDSHGFLRTGDSGYYDNDGYFYIVDRLKEMIKVSSFQVAPAELEGVLLSHDKIQDAAVIGIADPTHGEVPKAYIVSKNGSNLTERQVMDFVASKVIHYKHLKGGVEFIAEIPKAPSGKILRKDLRLNHAKKFT